MNCRFAQIIAFKLPARKIVFQLFYIKFKNVRTPLLIQCETQLYRDNKNIQQKYE